MRANECLFLFHSTMTINIADSLRCLDCVDAIFSDDHWPLAHCTADMLVPMIHTDQTLHVHTANGWPGWHSNDTIIYLYDVTCPFHLMRIWLLPGFDLTTVPVWTRINHTDAACMFMPSGSVRLSVHHAC